MATYPYETVIAYEDRTKIFTHDWRFAGINTLSSGNTDGGMLYFSLTKSGTTYTMTVYKVEAKASGDAVATGNVVSATAPSEASPLTIDLSESNSSGLTGTLKIASYASDESAGYLYVTLAVDSDCNNYFAGYTELNTYSSTAGLAAQHNEAMFEMIDKLTAKYAEFGGAGKSPWWQTGDKRYPDLRIILTPRQLRKAAAHYALYIALSASCFGEDSAYWELRDYHKEEYIEAFSQVQVSFDTDKDGDGDKRAAIGVSSWSRA